MCPKTANSLGHWVCLNAERAWGQSWGPLGKTGRSASAYSLRSRQLRYQQSAQILRSAARRVRCRSSCLRASATDRQLRRTVCKYDPNVSTGTGTNANAAPAHVHERLSNMGSIGEAHPQSCNVVYSQPQTAMAVFTT